MFEGKILGIAGKAVEGRMAGGTPYGSASGLLYQSQPFFVRRRFVVPAALAEIESCEERYLTTALLAFAEPEVSCIATANPSTLTRLLALAAEQAETLFRALHDGALPKRLKSSPVASIKITKQVERARRLEAAFREDKHFTCQKVWPKLNSLLTWAGGSCGFALEALRPQLTPEIQIIELGYLSSEFRGTINCDVGRSLCLPTLNDAFFEFVARQDWEAGGGDFLGLHELEEGQDYYVFITTPDGLYRYDMNDVLRVTGKVGATPTLSFLRKGMRATSITGEKLHENQALEAVEAALRAQSARADFFILLAHPADNDYELLVEPAPGSMIKVEELAWKVDRSLQSLNVEYQAKRDSKRLKALRVTLLTSGAGAAFRRAAVARGQRDAQFKHLHLLYGDECNFDFTPFQKIKEVLKCS